MTNSTTENPPQDAMAAYRRALYTTGLAQLLASGSVYLMSLLPRLLAHQEIVVQWRGAIMAAYSLANLAGILTCGKGVGRLGYRTTALLGWLAAIAGCLGYVAGTRWMACYFAARALHGFGGAWLIISMQGWLLETSQTGGRGHAIGRVNSPGFLMMALMPPVSEAMSRVAPPAAIFLLAAVLTALTLPLAVGVPSTLAVHEEAVESLGRDTMHRDEWGLAIFLLAQGFAFSFALVMVPLLTDPTRGWAFSLFFAAYGLVGFIMRTLLQPWLLRWLPHRLQTTTGCLVAGSTILLALIHQPALYFALGCVFGLGHALFFPSALQLATRHAKPGNLLQRFGKLSAASLIGAMLGEASSGLAAGAFGVQHACAYEGAAILTLQLVVLASLYFGARNRARPEALGIGY